MHCPGLESVNLMFFAKVMDAGLQALVGHCPYPESVILKGCSF